MPPAKADLGRNHGVSKKVFPPHYNSHIKAEKNKSGPEVEHMSDVFDVLTSTLEVAALVF